MQPVVSSNKILYNPIETQILNKKIFNMLRFLSALILASCLLVSCSKKSGGGDPTPVDPAPHETDILKFIPDSMFRAYLKANVCPNAFDKTGKFIDISNSEVKNFTGVMNIDTFTCPRPFVASLKGVEYFSKMKKLIVKNSLVDSLNLTATMGLDTLRIVENRDMQYFALSGCTSMRYIRIVDAPMTSLNLSNLPELDFISLISLKRLNELKTDNDAKLHDIVTSGLSALNTVNVSTNSELRRMFFDFASSMNSLDVTHNTKLRQLLATFCPSLKRVDLSKCDSLLMVQFDQSGIDSIDFSHNPKLFSVAMLFTPIKNLNMNNNPNLKVLWLDGCTQLQTVDVRAQTSFDFYFIDHAKYQGISDADMFEMFKDGWSSPVQTPLYSMASPATRAGVNGATINLYGGLRVPQYLDASGLSLTQVKINDACKDNYSLVMARRTFGNMTPVLVTVYAADKTTVVCPDYDPTLFKCN
jgi:hypothetical protein